MTCATGTLLVRIRPQPEIQIGIGREVMHVRTFAIVVSITFLAATTSRATDKWVDPTTGSDSNPGTETSPYGTIGKAISVLTPITGNHNIYLYAGTYDTSGVNAE